MRRTLAWTALGLAAATGAQGQDRPPVPPVHTEAPAPRPPERPGRAVDSGQAPHPAAPSDPQPAVAADTPAAAAAGAAPPQGGAAQPVPPVPQGPPLFETLRENDFDDAACRLALHVMGVGYRMIPAITDAGQRDCGIARPVEITQILPGIELTGGASMRCDTARALAGWMRQIVVPAASHLPNAPRITELTLGSTYQCRGVIGNGESHGVSEHALGNAIDIAAFTFDDGTRIEIAPPADRGDLAVAFQNAVQGAACLFFTTVLGPGSNAAHENHLHLDIKARRGGFRLCQ